MCQIALWSCYDILGLSEATLKIAEEMINKTANDMHEYFIQELRMPYYATRQSQLFKIVHYSEFVFYNRRQLHLAKGFFNFGNYATSTNSFEQGPTPLPLLGNLLTLKRLNIENASFQWQKQYGDFFTVWFGTKPAVMIGDYNTLVETFIKDGETFAGRSKDIPHDRGIVMADGPLWKDQRRFALHVLRNFGLGRNLMQERVLNEVSMLISAVKEEMKKGIENETIKEFIISKELTQKTVRNNGNPVWRIAQFNPELFLRLPFFSKTVERMLNEKQMLKEVFAKKVQNHKRKIDFEADQEPTDYAEAFLRHQYKLDKDGVKDHYYRLV
uniref:Cytochrome P450 n=1 Tax=Panagrolaimus sp. ES5 TaxID=591445 RepID=A0AC34FJU2_9BILA